MRELSSAARLGERPQPQGCKQHRSGRRPLPLRLRSQLLYVRIEDDARIDRLWDAVGNGPLSVQASCIIGKDIDIHASRRWRQTQVDIQRIGMLQSVPSAGYVTDSLVE